MFLDCELLEHVKVERHPDDNQDYGINIPHRAFSGCKSLKTVDSPPFAGIGSGAFYRTGLTSIELSEELKSIGIDAFAESQIQSIDIPASVSRLERGAFRGAPLSKVTGCEGITYIGKRAFEGTTDLESIPYMPLLEELSPLAFMDSGIASFVFGPNFITENRGAYDLNINDKQFKNCTNLKELVCLCLPPLTKFKQYSEEDNAFAGCNVDFIDVHVPAGKWWEYQQYYPWYNFKWYYDDAEEYLQKYLAAGVEDVESEQSVDAVSITSSGVNVEYGIGKSIHVYDTMGRMCYSSRHYDGEDIPLGKGLYILTVDGKATKIKI